MKTSIATVSISGEFEEKLSAIQKGLESATAQAPASSSK